MGPKDIIKRKSSRFVTSLNIKYKEERERPFEGMGILDDRSIAK